MALRFSTTADGAGIWGVYGRFSMLGLTSKGVPPQGEFSIFVSAFV